MQITIRNVPEEVRNRLAARADRAGQSLSQFLRLELEKLAARPSQAEWVARVRAHKEAPGLNRVTVKDILEARDADKK